MTTRPDFETHLAALETFLLSCVQRRDWHGVSDAATDIRVLEATRATFDGYPKEQTK
jgi:hypothetical protein